MSRQSFLVVVLAMVSLILGLRALGERAIAEATEDRARLERDISQRQAAKAEFQAALAQDRVRQLRLELARVLPEKFEEPPVTGEQHQIRQLASLARPPVRTLEIASSTSAFEAAKRAFRKGEFVQAHRMLRDLIANFPDSIHIIDAHFLLAESLFQQEKIDDCIQVIEQMVQLFPESEATGFALLRLGKIYESRDRIEDAAMIYRSITKYFANPSLQSQSARLLSRTGAAK